MQRPMTIFSARLVTRYAYLWLLPLLLVLLTSSVSAQTFIRGDANGDGDVDFYLGDSVALLEHLFSGCASVVCDDAADANDDGSLSTADVIFNLTSGMSSTALPGPYPGCGPDPTVDSLVCAVSCPTFTGYTPNPAFLLEVAPVAGGSGTIGSIVTVEIKLTIPTTFDVTGLSFGVCHDPTKLQLLPATITSGALVPDFFSAQNHPTGFNVNLIPSLTGSSTYSSGVNVVAEAQYQILASGTHTVGFCFMTGSMPVPVALSARSTGSGSCHVVFAPSTVASTIVGFSDFIRGDTNADGTCDLADAVNLLGCIFLSSGTCNCDDASDVNDDGTVNIGDVIYKLSFLFTGGSPPPSPYPGCGPDPTLDSLGCASFPPCP
ncbi:MAG TPA: hypothetical protein EYN79_01265 [Planctomycetes bacterium]|nr:hypothetical protein [Planctomycetota bacterium]